MNIEKEYLELFKLVKEHSKKSINTDYSIDFREIQIANLGDQSIDEEFEYIKNTDSKYIQLHGLLNGAIANSDGTFNNQLFAFLKNRLKLLWGAYCFIDGQTNNVENNDAKAYYLLGPISDGIKPSFTFPMFVNTKNFRGNREFLKVDSRWMKFYTSLNTLSREVFEFKEDFPRYFEKETDRRNKSIEHKHNMLYLSSGEIDHSILQWLTQMWNSDNNENSSIKPDSKFPINLLDLAADYPNARRFLNDNSFAKKYFLKNQNGLFVKVLEKRERLKKNKLGWLYEFSYLNKSDLPTERMIAAIEFFYYHLKETLGYEELKLKAYQENYDCSDIKKKQKRLNKNHIKEQNFSNKAKTLSYFEPRVIHGIQSGKYYNILALPDASTEQPTFIIPDKKIISDFINSVEAFLPVKNNYKELKEEITSDDQYKKLFKCVLENYLEVLNFYSKKPDFYRYCRFNVFSHFFQRCIYPILKPFHREQTCRGFITIPVFSNPDNDNKSHPYYGYFMAIIKDSDDKGRCFFNWRLHSNNLHSNKPIESKTIKWFYEEYLFYLQNFGYQLAQNEVKQVYYKGIVEKHLKENLKNTIKNSLASIVARGLSHTDGSHSMIYFEKNYEDLILSGKHNLAHKQFKQFNRHLRDLMELTADITGGIGKQTSYGFNFLEVLKEINGKLENNTLIEGYFPNPYDIISDYEESESNFINKNNVSLRSFISDAIVDNKFRCCLDFDSNCNKQILLPGGVNSITALLQILKNIYRNIFKHNYGSEKVDDTKLEIVTLTLSVDEIDCDKEKDKKDLKPHFYKLTIRESVKTDGNIDRLKSIVKSDILNDNNEVDGKAWGIKEIKIQAAYILGLALEETNNLSAIFPNKDWYDVEVKDGYLEHYLYFKKEKKAVVITDNRAKEKKAFVSKGIYYKYLNQSDLNNWHLKIDKDFEYVIFDKDYKPDNIESVKASKSRNFKILLSDPKANSNFKFDEIDQIWCSYFYNQHSKKLDASKYYFDDDHSIGIIENECHLLRKDKTVKKSIWNKIGFYEAYEHYAFHQKLICLNTKVAILDERLQEEFLVMPNNHIQYLGNENKKIFEIDILEKKGVFLPKNKKLHQLFYNKEKSSDISNEKACSFNDFKKLEKLLRTYFYKRQFYCGYVVLHFSGLEAIANSISNDKLLSLKDMMPGLKSATNKDIEPIDIVYTYLVKHSLNLPGSNKYLILTSGKGTPTTLPNHSFFINLANIERLLKNKGVTKLDIVKTLQSIRQITNKL